jgi:hypothetical protein
MECWIFVLILKQDSKPFESSNSVPFCDNNQSFFNVAEIFSHYRHSAYLWTLAGNRDRKIEDFVIGLWFDHFISHVDWEWRRCSDRMKSSLLTLQNQKHTVEGSSGITKCVVIWHIYVRLTCDMIAYNCADMYCDTIFDISGEITRKADILNPDYRTRWNVEGNWISGSDFFSGFSSFQSKQLPWLRNLPRNHCL